MFYLIPVKRAAAAPCETDEGIQCQMESRVNCSLLIKLLRRLPPSIASRSIAFVFFENRFFAFFSRPVGYRAKQLTIGFWPRRRPIQRYTTLGAELTLGRARAQKPRWGVCTSVDTLQTTGIAFSTRSLRFPVRIQPKKN